MHEAWRKTSQGGSQYSRLSCLRDTMANTSEASSSTLQHVAIGHEVTSTCQNKSWIYAREQFAVSFCGGSKA